MIEVLKKKFEEYYISIKDDLKIFDIEEAINYFTTIKENGILDYPSITIKDIDSETEINDIDDILEYLSYTYDIHIKVNLSENEELYVLYTKLLNYVLNMKNENEKNELVLLLINNFYEYNLKFPFEDEKTDKYLEFIEESSEEDKFDLFINDNEFNLDIMFVTIESMEQNNSYNSVTFINELYRKFVIDFSNFNFEIGYLETESHKLINYFLKNNFNIDENIYNNNPIVINCNDKNFKTILKLIIISDYYKLNFSVKDEENYISETDLKYLEIINKSSINDLLKFFDISDDFSLKAIEDFILLNEYLQNNYNKSKVDEKTLKKINPFYILDKITEKKDI